MMMVSQYEKYARGTGKGTYRILISNNLPVYSWKGSRMVGFILLCCALQASV